MSRIATLNAKRLRPTSQRKLILNVVHDSGARPTSEDITGIVQAKMPRINKSTIYRTPGAWVTSNRAEEI